ncbi:glutathione S-transferase E14-like [Cydia splendana]|uniref:glutathione S-transferase E14-like n=1 Tax=Cydia splendana TaxID=1100963 RepID=UPI002136088D
MAYFNFNNLFRVRVITRCCSTNWTVNKTMNNKLILYGDEASPPVRFALMVASVLKIKLEYQHVDLFKAENKSPFYTKINQLQKVPALQIGDDVICDSHAIALYLCRIGEGRRLYPKNPITRAKVDQTMFFNSGTLFPIDSYIFTEYFRGKWPANDVKIQEWHSAVDRLEHLLVNQMWLACDKVTLADLCCATTVSSLQLLLPPLDRHVKVKQWLDRLQKLSCYEINLRGLERLKSCICSLE